MQGLREGRYTKFLEFRVFTSKFQQTCKLVKEHHSEIKKTLLCMELVFRDINLHFTIHIDRLGDELIWNQHEKRSSHKNI